MVWGESQPFQSVWPNISFYFTTSLSEKKTEVEAHVGPTPGGILDCDLQTRSTVVLKAPKVRLKGTNKYPTFPNPPTQANFWAGSEFVQFRISTARSFPFSFFSAVQRKFPVTSLQTISHKQTKKSEKTLRLWWWGGWSRSGGNRAAAKSPENILFSTWMFKHSPELVSLNPLRSRWPGNWPYCCQSCTSLPPRQVPGPKVEGLGGWSKDSQLKKQPVSRRVRAQKA